MLCYNICKFYERDKDMRNFVGFANSFYYYSYFFTL